MDALGCGVAKELLAKSRRADDLAAHVDVDFVEIGTSNFRTLTQTLPSGS